MRESWGKAGKERGEDPQGREKKKNITQGNMNHVHFSFENCT